jgi:hypothetical protein
MDATNTIAWIGAITGSIGTITGVSALAWDFYEWKQCGPKLQVEVMPGMAMMNIPRTDPNDRFIWVRVINTGQGKTTIQTLAFAHFETEPNKEFTKPNPTYQGVVISPSFNTGPALPHRLKPGGEWSGFARQDEEMEKRARAGYLYARVYHTMGQGKTISQRVIIKDESLAPRRQ